MDCLTWGKKKESENDPSEQNDDIDENSKKDIPSDANTNEEQSGAKSGDISEKPEEETVSEDRSNSGESSENSTVDDSNPQEANSEKAPGQEDVMSNDDSGNSQEVEEAEPKSGTEDVENSEANDNEENDELEVIPMEEKKFTFDEMVEIAGYGHFQRKLTFLAGLGWMADAFEIRVLSLLGGLIACDWTVYMWQSATLTSIVFFGMIFGAPLFGMIADNYGRRKSLAISLLCVSILGASSALSPSIQILIVVRCFTGFVFGGAYQGFTICAEYYPVKNRGTAGFYLRYYWAFGTILLILLTWLIIEQTNNWHWLIVAAATPSLIVFFSMNWFPESARFYLVSGQYEKAVEQLQQLLVANRCTELQATQLKKIPDEEREVQGNLLDLMRSPFTKTTLILWYISFAVSFHYFGITLISPYVITEGNIMVPQNEFERGPVINETDTEFYKSVVRCKHMTKDNYVNMLWNSCSEFVGLIIFTLVVRFVQRRVLLSVSCMVNAFASLLLLAEAKSPVSSQVVLFLARANCTGILQLTMIITSETFPTTLRATGVGSGEAFMRLGGALVPFLAQILIIEDPIASVCIMGAVILGAAAGGAYLPRDTKGIPLKELTEHQRQADAQKQEADKEKV